MKENIFLFLGIISIASNYFKIILVETPIIVGFFVIYIILYVYSVHKKNKERRIPRPVYLTN